MKKAKCDGAPINVDDVFRDVERQRESGALAQAIREANKRGPVYGLDRENHGDQVMAYYPDGTVKPVSSTHSESS